MHPLYGQKMKLLTVSKPMRGNSHALVLYPEGMALRIEVAATNLVPPKPVLLTKFTSQSLEQLIQLAKECEVICQSIQEKSGSSYQKKSKTKSLRNSAQCAKR